MRALRRRLIPAHAGKTITATPPLWELEAHPRSRGENCRLPDARRRVEGSSPLTRGKHLHRETVRPLRGLIPAHAGKTPEGRRSDCRGGAHPRSRGENAAGIASVALTQGSSPLTRGKPCKFRRLAARWRLIPAHAGKTTRPPHAQRRGWAHPRSRGENCSRGPSPASH